MIFSIYKWIVSLYSLSAIAYILAVVEAENNPVEE